MRGRERRLEDSWMEHEHDSAFEVAQLNDQNNR